MRHRWCLRRWARSLQPIGSHVHWSTSILSRQLLRMAMHRYPSRIYQQPIFQKHHHCVVCHRLKDHRLLQTTTNYQRSMDNMILLTMIFPSFVIFPAMAVRKKNESMLLRQWITQKIFVNKHKKFHNSDIKLRK